MLITRCAEHTIRTRIGRTLPTASFAKGCQEGELPEFWSNCLNRCELLLLRAPGRWSFTIAILKLTTIAPRVFLVRWFFFLA